MLGHDVYILRKSFLWFYISFNISPTTIGLVWTPAVKLLSLEFVEIALQLLLRDKEYSLCSLLQVENKNQFSWSQLEE